MNTSAARATSGTWHAASRAARTMTLMLALLAQAAFAATDTWVGGSGNSFSTTANWTYSSGTGPVASGDTLVFGGAGSTTPNNDLSAFTFNNIGFAGTVAYTLSGNDFTLASGGSITNGGAVTQTINNNIALAGAGTFSPSVSGSAITLGGVISGANLTKSGNSSSTLTLSGANTFSGTLTFNSGTVVFTTPPNPSGANLGNPSGITFGGSSTTTLVTTPGAGSVTISSPTITANASSTALFKNGAAAGTIYEISAKVTGAGNCKQNTPTTTGAIVRFSNDANDYAGVFTMAGGIVEFTSVGNGGSSAALGGKGSGTYAVINSTTAATLRYVGSASSSTTRNIDWQGTSGGLTLDNTNAGSVQFLGTGNMRSGSGNAGLTLTGSNTGANTLGQVINDGAASGTTSLSKSGAGTWVLSGANSYSAGTTVSAGTLQISGSGTLGNVAGALNLTGGTLDLGGSSQTAGAVTLSGGTLLTNGTLTASSFSAAPASSTTATAAANLAGSSAAVSHTGAGTLALLGNSTYNGGTTVAGGGVLLYNSIAAAGSSCALGLSGALNLKSGAYQYLGSSATNSRTFQFSTLSGTPAWNIENAGTNTTLTLTADFLGGTNGGAAGGRSIGLNVNCSSDAGSAATLKMLGAIPDVTPTNSTTVIAGGATGYSVFNGGTVALLGLSNTFSGAAQVKYARTLQVMTLADAGTACSIGLGTNPPAGTAPIIIGSTDSMRGGVLAYIGTNDVSCNRQLCVEGVNFGGQSGATILNNSPGNNSLHLSCTLPVLYYSGVLISNCSFILGGSAAAVNTFDMPITNTPLGSAALTVSGSTWQLTAAHSYSGNTIVSGGTLLVNGSIGGNAVTNTVGTLGGTGAINCPVTIQSAGALRPGPGLGSIGTLAINNALNLAGKTLFQINRTNAQTADLVTGMSAVTYGGTLTVTNIGDPLQAGDTFTLFSAATYNPSVFAATNLPPLSENLVWDTSRLAVDGTITVGQLPTITLAPASQTVECASSATFTATAAGLPAPAYQWSVNGSPIDGATSTTFTTNNVHAAGSIYTIAVTVTNIYGSVSSNATLTVQDTVAPVITLNDSNIMIVQCHSTFTDPGATAVDACVGAVPAVPGGSVDTTTPGSYLLTYTADDGNGNIVTTNRTVHVVDTTAPVITQSFTNLVLSADGNCQAIMPDVTGTNYILATDNCSDRLTVTQTPTNNAVLALGTNEVVLAVDDGNGNIAYSTNTIVVADTTPPVITNCAPAQVVTAGSGGTAVLSDLTTLVVAGDACSGIVHVLQQPIPGTDLPVGTNTVVFYVDDGNGNTNTCSTTVTVNAAVLEPPVIVSEQFLGDGSFQITFSGPSSQTYKVLAAEDVALSPGSWDILTNGAFAAAPVPYIDTAATNHTTRFYRIVSP